MRRLGIFKNPGSGNLRVWAEMARPQVWLFPVGIIWHLSLGALTDCTQRCDPGLGHFNQTGNGQTWGLLVSEVWPFSLHRPLGGSNREGKRCGSRHTNGMKV